MYNYKDVYCSIFSSILCNGRVIKGLDDNIV